MNDTDYWVIRIASNYGKKDEWVADRDPDGLLRSTTYPGNRARYNSLVAAMYGLWDARAHGNFSRALKIVRVCRKGKKP